MRLTPVQKAERRDFVLNRLKRGFSFLEVQKQFVESFDCHMDTARKWANWACDQMAEKDDPNTRKRTYSVIVEMYHDQIVSYQNELLTMQKDIDDLGKMIKRRTEILLQLEFASSAQHRELVEELKALPEVGLTTRASLLEAKSRMRERMYRIMSDLARLRGFNGVSSDWRQALNTLLDNNLIPPAIADGILTVIDNFEGNIRSLEAQDPDEGNPEIGIDDLEIDDLDLPS